VSKRDWLGWVLVAVGLVVLGGCTGHGDRGQPSAPAAGVGAIRASAVAWWGPGG
jgi:multidrug efflux pump subunit AcrA (membrane-fusion protein)